MAKIKPKVLSFDPSPSTDVVGYKLYMEVSPTAVNYGSKMIDLGLVTKVDLGALEGMKDSEGVYNIGIIAIDASGNESSMSLLNDVPLDFVAPNPPGAIVLN